MAKLNSENFNRQVERAGHNVRGFCDAHGISYSSMMAWLAHKRNPKTSTVATLAKLLKCSRADIAEADGEDVCRPVFGRGTRGVPVITMQELASANTAIMSLPEWARSVSRTKMAFPSEKKDDIAIAVTGDGYLPRFPAGTLLLCRALHPTTGDLVLVLMDSGEVLIQTYMEGKKKFGFLSAGAGGVDKTVYGKSARTPVRSVYVVIESLRSEYIRSKDNAMSYPELD